MTHSRLAHPAQSLARRLWFGNAFWLGGKAGSPHFGQDIDIAACVSLQQGISLANIRKGISPDNIGLEQRNLYHGDKGKQKY
jgi:hypothetical protein